VWAHWSWSFCFGPQGEALGLINHLDLICIHESPTANAPLTINDVPSLPKGPWSHIFHTTFLDTRSLIFLVTFFAVWLTSDFVPTPYKLKLWPELSTPPLLVTCAMLIMYERSNTSFFTAPIHTWSLSEGLASLLPPAGFNKEFVWARKTISLSLPSCTGSFLWAG